MSLLTPITLYLLVFYISTSYSAFFKQFEIGLGTIDAILDANALGKAWSEGTLEVLFIIFIPFVFMGLGYLIHMFGENKNTFNYLKIVMLVLIAFIFDAILAYQIEDKIYELNKTANDPDFNIPIAFQKIEFWGIIFAGFIVYIVWGLVFDFLMKEHKEKDKIGMAIRERKSKLKIQQTELEKHEEDIGKLKESIAEREGKVFELNRLIESVIIPVKEYKLYASAYTKGWITAVSKFALEDSKKQNLIENCEITYRKHLEEVGASTHQNKYYKRLNINLNSNEKK